MGSSTSHLHLKPLWKMTLSPAAMVTGALSSPVVGVSVALPLMISTSSSSA